MKKTVLCLLSTVLFLPSAQQIDAYPRTVHKPLTTKDVVAGSITFGVLSGAFSGMALGLSTGSWEAGVAGSCIGFFSGSLLSALSLSGRTAKSYYKSAYRIWRRRNRSDEYLLTLLRAYSNDSIEAVMRGFSQQHKYELLEAKRALRSLSAGLDRACYYFKIALKGYLEEPARSIAKNAVLEISVLTQKIVDVSLAIKEHPKYQQQLDNQRKDDEVRAQFERANAIRAAGRDKANAMRMAAWEKANAIRNAAREKAAAVRERKPNNVVQNVVVNN